MRYHQSTTQFNCGIDLHCHSHRLQRASDLAGPWTTFTSLTAPPDGAVEHLEPAPLSFSTLHRVAAP